MENRRAWRFLDYSRDVFMHHRKFTPFQKFIFVSVLMGVLLLFLRNWLGLMLVTNYGLSVYCAIKILQLLASKNVFLPSDRILGWVETIEGVVSAICVPQVGSRTRKQSSTESNVEKESESEKYQNSHLKNTEHSVRISSVPVSNHRVSLTNSMCHDHCSLDTEVQKITKLIHRDFFIAWYDLFTKEELVWSEAEVILIMIVDSLQGRLVKASIPNVLRSIMILYRTHICNLKEAEFMFKAQSKRRKSSVRPRDSNAGIEVRQRKTLEECYWTKTEMHPALQSTEFELAYQKAVVDCLLLHLLPNELLEIKTLVTAVKEILSVNLLQNLISSISETIFLYEKVILITSDEEPLDCDENKSSVCVIETNQENVTSSVHPILVNKDSATKTKVEESLKNSTDSTSGSEIVKFENIDPETKSEIVTWKNDTKTYPVLKSFCCECNRLCSKDRDKIPSRSHTCSVGSADKVQKYDRLSVKDSLSGDQCSINSDSNDSNDSRSSPAFVLSLSDSDSDVFKDDRHSVTSIPDETKTLALNQRERRGYSPGEKYSSSTNDDLSISNSSSDINRQGKRQTTPDPEGEKGIRNFNLPNIPNFFPKFTLNLPNPLSSIQKPLSIGPLKLSPSDPRANHDKDDQCLDVNKSESSGVILRRKKTCTPVTPKDTPALNGSTGTEILQQPVFQDIQITSTESAKEPGANSLYTLYEIQFEAVYQSDTKILLHKTGTVKRRFRECVNLQTRLEETSEYKKCMKDIKGPKKLLPSLPFGNMGRETLEGRKNLLENFLQALIKKEPICNSEEMKQFLGYSGDGHIAFVRKASESSIPRIDQRLVKTMSGVFDKIVEGLPSLPQQIPRMMPSFESPEEKKDEPEQLEDKDHIDVDIALDSEETPYENILDKFMYDRKSCALDGNDGKLHSSGNTSVDLGVSVLGWETHHRTTPGSSPGASPKASRYSKHIAYQSSPLSSSSASLTGLLDPRVFEVHGEPRNGGGIKDPSRDDVCPLSDAILDILTELLRGQDTWMCRDTVMNSTRLVFGKGLNRYLQTKINLLTSEEMISLYLNKFRQAFWPGDVFSAEGHPPYTDFQREVIMKQAKRCLGDFLPGVLKVLLGTDDFGHILDEAIHSVKYEQLNRHVWYSILDILIEEVFPEINSQELQRKLSVAMEKS